MTKNYKITLELLLQGENQEVTNHDLEEEIHMVFSEGLPKTGLNLTLLSTKVEDI